MKIGYSYWGFLGDVKLDEAGNVLSTPDGNATYSWSIIWELQRRGHTVYAMQEDRDWPAYRRMGDGLFASFSCQKRTDAYRAMKHTFGSSEILPELDILLCEWRFPIPGRNCTTWDGAVCEFPASGLNHQGQPMQPDLKRQTEILRHYKGKKTKIILWDLDHKLTEGDERVWTPDAILETSHSPLRLTMDRTRVEPPTLVADLLQHPTLPSDPNRKLVYIGSRYERDDVIDRWLGPVSEKYPGQVEFHGKWDDDAKARWPKISMHQRCTVSDFRKIYGTAGACPLLAKQSYLETGFITPRPWEALLFGTIPVGLGDANGVDQYTPWVAGDPSDMVEVAEVLCGMMPEQRHAERKNLAEMLDFMDVKHFVDKLEAT